MESRSEGKTIILHLSDLHAGLPFDAKAAEALISLAHDHPTDVIAVSGDFTQRAKEEQYIAARAFLDRLPRRPMLCIPGNHDLPLYRVVERLTAPYVLYQRYINADLEPTLTLPSALIVGLNTIRPLQRITNGVIDSRQLDQLEARFKEVGPHTARIVVMHHHLLPNQDPLGKRALRGSLEALRRLEAMRVELVLSGHLHCSYIGNSTDAIPSSIQGHGVTIVQSGSSTSKRGRGRERLKNSCNLIEIGPSTIRIVHYIFSAPGSAFYPMSEHLFPRWSQPHL